MSAGKKNKKKNKTTISLNEFLTDDKGSKPTVYMPASSSSWADEVDNDAGEEMDYGGPSAKLVNIAALPTAPRAARGADVDMSRVPTNPPFTAFLGNIPFDVEIETIEKFFHGFTIVNIRLPEENGRMKGFGYVEFEDRQMLVDALNLNDSMLKNRKVRIDLAGQSQDGKDRGHGGGMGRDRDDGEDRTLGDWRRNGDKPASSFESRSSDRYDDRGGYGGGSRYDDRGGGYGGGRDDRGSRYDDRGGYGGGGRDRYDDRGGGYGRDGGSFGRSDQGSWGHDRSSRNDDRSDDRRSFGSGYRDGGDRGGYRDGGDRGGYRDGGFRRDDRYGDRPPRRDNDRSYGAPKDDYSAPRDRMPEDRDGPPKERPRLNLQPRSKPKEADVKSGESQTSSIFGGAKPVNTAAREREIEERLARQNDIGHDRDRRGPPERPRIRQDSAGSEEGRGAPRRERKTSSSSSGKGIRTVAPPPTASRVRSESSRSEEEVFEEKETKKEKAPEAKLVPAPPPKENVWAKRKPTAHSDGPKSPPSKENASHPVEKAAHNEKRQPMSDSNRSKGKYEPPVVNVWDKKKKEVAAPKEKKEKPLPQSIDEMPKYEAAKRKDFSDSNKFAGLLDDEEAE
ncbi:hypothetical protein CAPTEDRAFT_221548 [Capitella teleta]|uniref:RRM domain-containing protein n=1 Tax=Capitella teleta TaxID=283909 RepID=R7TZR9_CAPTE|nr:hypothetical protein CAPTEDRAFT_221548 [Capitella teleta]|eukprot:ELT99249.1 hypothetical protein CAPTEDRAFT_221548 [Capitella teleta]